MTKDQESYFAMALKLKNFYAKNTAAINVLAAVVPFYTQLNNLINQLITADAGSRADLTGYAMMKANKRKSLEVSVQKVSNGIAAMAVVNGDLVLQKRADYPASSWYLASEEKLVTEATIVSNLAAPVAASLVPFMVSAADVAALTTNLNAFVSVISDPTLAIDARKENNKEVVRTIDEIRTLLTGKIDVLMRSFELSNPSLYGLYNSARAIDKNGAATAPTAEVEVQPVSAKTVDHALNYDPERFYTIENMGNMDVFFSLSTTDNQAGADEVLLEPGQTRVRLAQNLAPTGTYLVVHNPNNSPVPVRVWVE